jgi:type II secretory pathway component PulM
MAGADLTALTAEVTRNTDVDASAIALLNGLAAKIQELKNDPAALDALAVQLRTSSTALADAVTANTPVDAPPPAP